MRHALTLAICLLASLHPAVAAAASADERVVLVVDRVVLDGPTSSTAAFVRVGFRQSYPETPLVFVLPTDDNPDPAAVRIIDVDRTGFSIALLESPGEDGSSVATTLDYFAVLPLARRVQGVEFEAGRLTTGTVQGRSAGATGWDPVAFSRPKNGAPLVLTQLQSANNEPGILPGVPSSPWMTTVVRNTGAAGFEVAIERSEDGGTLSAPETLAWFAMDGDTRFVFPDVDGNEVQLASSATGTVTGHDNGCTAIDLGTSFPGIPRLFAGKVSRNGSDGGWLRRCSASPSTLGLLVDEDRASDGERSHTQEQVRALAFERSFSALRAPPQVGQKPFDGEVDRVAIPSASGARGRFTDVSFPEAFAPGVTPLVFVLPTETDPDPAALRVRDRSASGFRIAAVEPSGEKGAHGAMTIDYIAIEAGTHRLDDGRLLEAGFVDTARFVSNGVGSTGFDRITFTPGRFAAAPALLTGLQSIANEPTLDPSVPSVPFLTSVVEAIDASGADVALERSEVATGAVVAAERIGWLAAEAAVRGTLFDRSGTAVVYDFSRGATVTGFDNGCTTVPYTQAFAASPLVIADKNTRAGNNGGWLRRCAPPGPSGVGLHVDEDRFADPERDHIGESVSVLAFDRPFAWGPTSPDIRLEKTLLTIADPVAGTLAPKAIPGARIEQRIVATNEGRGITDDDSVVVSALIPDGLALFLGDLDGSGAPFLFVDGAPPSGLALDFGALDDPVDGVEFTADAGATWTYQPVPGTTLDPAVDGFRLRLSGSFERRLGSEAPSFEIRYQVEVE
ncbi:MAG: hypothetical protein V2I63_05605 [Pseudomonadales bacterium]|nr:hypothetical protein [Pseudomonadales bacterium]